MFLPPSLPHKLFRLSRPLLLKACVMNVAESLNVAVKDLAAAVDTKRAAFYIYKHIMGGGASVFYPSVSLSVSLSLA